MDTEHSQQPLHAVTPSVTPSPSTFSCVSPEPSPSLSSLPTPAPVGQQQLVIVDWDDTLMPTTYLVKNIVLSTNEKNEINAFQLSPGLDTKDKIDEFKTNLRNAARAAFDLLNALIHEFGASNLKIVTNARRGWIVQSLCITSNFSSMFTQIHALLREHRIELFYARDASLPCFQWKTKCIGNMLWTKLNRRPSTDDRLKVTTIGDQWWDHECITDSLAFRVYGDAITRHQLKLFNGPPCEYLVTELNYVQFVIENGLLNQSEDVTLEFDGYNENEKKKDKEVEEADETADD